MTLEQYAYLVEIIGGVVVIVTLVFLVIQLRQNTVALQSATLLGTHSHTLAVHQMLAEDSMMEALIKGAPGSSDLTPVQKGKFNAFWTVAFQNYQQFFFQVRAGTYDGNILDGWWQVLRDDFLSPGLQAFWKKRKFVLTPEFRNFVDEEVMTRQPTPGYVESLARRGIINVNE